MKLTCTADSRVAWWFHVMYGWLLCLMSDYHMCADILTEHWFYSTIVRVYLNCGLLFTLKQDSLCWLVYTTNDGIFSLCLYISLNHVTSVRTCVLNLLSNWWWLFWLRTVSLSTRFCSHYECVFYLHLKSHCMFANRTCSVNYLKNCVVDEWSDAWTLNVEWIYY